MKRFLTLLGKELKELMTIQMLIPFLIGVLVFFFIGKVAGSETQKAMGGAQTLVILDQDRTETSAALIADLETRNFRVHTFEGNDVNTAISGAREKGVGNLFIIPSGFEQGIAAYRPQEIMVYNLINNFSLTGSMSARTSHAVLTVMNEVLSSRLISQKVAGVNPDDLKNPLRPKNVVVIGEKSAQVSPVLVTGFITSQTAFLPIVMFMIIIIAAQMIAVTIASEKENKTLETLLSTPVSRIALVSAKMIAAGLVSLLVALFYMVGFRYYMNGLMGPAASEMANPQLTAAISQLGLTLDLPAYVLLGLSLFLSIMIALAISLILGAFAEDVKTAQGLIAPITFLIMVPYMLVMFVNVDTASPALRYIIYAIPFSHPFLAAPNLFLHKLWMVQAGIIYQGVFFLVLLFFAARIFTTDRILTMKLNLRKKGFLMK